MASGIHISLIIATLQDEGDLRLCLESLCRQDKAPAFEVILVDQNEAGYLDGIVQDYSSRLRLIHRHVDFQGACRARNLGADLAHGEWLGFPDDDCRLLPNTLALVEQFSRDMPDVKVITGRTVNDEGKSNVLRWSEQDRFFNRKNMFGSLTEATLFVHRTVFMVSGGFDIRFGPGSQFPAAEGVDLMNRIFNHIQLGQAYYNPGIMMLHPTKIPPWNRWAVARFHSYAIGDGALIAKSPQPHILNWGFRTLAVAILYMCSFRGWQSLAYGARFIGLFRGFTSYLLCGRKR